MNEIDVGIFLDFLANFQFSKDSLSYIWFMFMGMWGGTISYIERYKINKIHSTHKLIMEWLISSFTGITTAYFGRYLDLPFSLIAALSGIAGHMGGRGLYQLENIIKEKGSIIKLLGGGDSDKHQCIGSNDSVVIIFFKDKVVVLALEIRVPYTLKNIQQLRKEVDNGVIETPEVYDSFDIIDVEKTYSS